MENMARRLIAEFIGTFWLVLGGCGAAVLAATFVAPRPPRAPAFPSVNIGFVGVSLAFGLTVLTGVYALGHISGGHFNPDGRARGVSRQARRGEGSAPLHGHATGRRDRGGRCCSRSSRTAHPDSI